MGTSDDEARSKAAFEFSMSFLPPEERRRFEEGACEDQSLYNSRKTSGQQSEPDPSSIMGIVEERYPGYTAIQKKLEKYHEIIFRAGNDQ